MLKKCAGSLFFLWLLSGPSLIANSPHSLTRPINRVEVYSERPSIFSIKPKEHTGLEQSSFTNRMSWNSLKRGHLEVLAELVELYPDFEIYFLARDAELLYDLATCILKQEPETLKRLHLLNISRTNRTADHILDYLAQEGISLETLKKGKKVLFVDTGFNGTIPQTIDSYFPEHLRSHLKTHLLTSANPKYPSTRVFLTTIHPRAASQDPTQFHAKIIDYEHMPRFTYRSHVFRRLEGRWEASSTSETWTDSPDGQVNRGVALQYMEDISYYGYLPSTVKLFAERRAVWKRLRDRSVRNDSKELVGELKKVLESDSIFGEATVRDFLEVLSLNLKDFRISVSLGDLGLTEIGMSEELSNKNTLIQQYPHWAPVLQDPEKKIRELLNKGEWATLYSIVNAINDAEFLTILVQTLEQSKASSVMADSFLKLIENNASQSLLRRMRKEKERLQEKCSKDLLVPQQAP